MAEVAFFDAFPEGTLWYLLSHLEIKDLVRMLLTSQAGVRVLRDDQFWCYLYYRQLIPSPLYYDVQHNQLVESQAASWHFMYLEQLWIQHLHLNYSPNGSMKYLHRTLSSGMDGKWQVVEEAERAHIGPFDAHFPKLAFMYHLGFKAPTKTLELQAGEVTGCFNWAPPNIANLESDIGSLLPPPQKSEYFDPTHSDKLAGGKVDKWYEANKQTNVPDQLNVEWFVSGAREFVSALAHSLSEEDHYSDYWQECSEATAGAMLRQLLSSRPAFLVSAPPSSPLEANLRQLDLDFAEDTGDVMDRDAAMVIQQAIFRLAKLGLPRSSYPALDTPVRYFICANASVSPFEMNQHYAIVLVALDRIVALTWCWPVPDHAFANFDSSVVNLRDYMKSCV